MFMIKFARNVAKFCVTNQTAVQASLISKTHKPLWGFCHDESIVLNQLFHSTSTLSDNKITVNFVDRHGKSHKATATVGDSLLDAVIDNDLMFETYGVCEGTVSCSTCHVILDKKTYDDLEEPLMDEMDMLDLACGLSET